MPGNKYAVAVSGGNVGVFLAKKVKKKEIQRN